MSQSSIDLLRLLASGVRPDGAALSRGRSPVEHADFAELLSRVRAGGVSSNEPVSIAPGVDVGLTTEQLGRLAVAIDAAQAAGQGRVLALIDGLALDVDVEERTVTAAHAPSDARLLTGFDAVVSVPAGSPEHLSTLFGAARSPRPPTSPLASLFRIRSQPLSELLAPSSTPAAADAA